MLKSKKAYFLIGSDQLPDILPSIPNKATDKSIKITHKENGKIE
jgi:hypothetical protein